MQSSLLHRVTGILSRHAVVHTPFTPSALNIASGSTRRTLLQTRNVSDASAAGTSWRQHTLNNLTKGVQNAQPSNNDKIWQSMSAEARLNTEANPPKDAYSGRSVHVRHGKVAEAIRLVEGILSRNQVRKEVRMSQRHEKKGVKRRRLSSERWRKQFANEVRKKVQLVTKMRNRGA